ncbi:class F sortase [Tessaracoccus sp. HDW20]|uniref:class F sortase n=1 Tax=Tessaracoccus coleopterorum TaxID=2714950 RepID=UPI0018D41C03|nr:class F sortase [Tessaracoccus coleopterorum]NHB83961.1 class F sortase [Tessaracoccus coleopterorum]
MSHAAEQPRPKSTKPIIALVVVIAIAVGLLIWGVTSRGGDTPDAGPTTTPVVTTTNSAVEPVAPARRRHRHPPDGNPSVAGCTAVTEGFVPDRFTIERFDADERVVALNLDKQGNIAAPPLNEPRMAAWWSGGPKPGADKGRAILTIHTYRTGNALGNEFFRDGQSHFQPGDLLKLHGPDGQVQCYEYSDAQKITVADYAEIADTSTMMYDPDGPPSLSIIICWDFEKATEVWNSRVFFNFTPVTVIAD